VCQLRPFVYSLGLNNAPRISFTLVKSSVKNIRHFEHGASRCKMAGAGFHFIAKLRAPFHGGVEFRTAECSKCFISLGGFFFNSNIFLGEKTQTDDSDVGGPNRDPVLILNLDPGSNPDGSISKSGSGSESRFGREQIRLPNPFQDKFSNKSGSVFIFHAGYKS
jgi:hypothetical protein